METNNQNEKKFEYLCYILAGICALMFFFTPTTKDGEVINFDGSNQVLRWEIAFFGWLIVGRITALISKKTCIEQEQQPQISLNDSNTMDKLSDDSSDSQKNESNYEIREFSEQFPNYEQYEVESFAIYKKSNHMDDFKRRLTPIIKRIIERAKQEGYTYDSDSIVLFFWDKFNKKS